VCAVQLKALAAHHAVSVSAGKHRTAVITSLGTVFAWDGARDQKPDPLRIPNLKQTTHIAVGESHSVAVATVWIPPFPLQTTQPQEVSARDSDFAGDENSDEELEVGMLGKVVVAAGRAPGQGSLKSLCQREIAHSIVEAKNVLQMVELADALEADELKAFSQAMVLRNLDYILMVTPTAILAQIRPSVLAELEGLMGSHVAQGGWVPRKLPCATSSKNVLVLEEEDDSGERARESRMRSEAWEERVVMDVGQAVGIGLGRFLQQKDELGAVRRIRALRKKLQQIEALEARHGEGYALDAQQRAKVRSKEDIQLAVEALEQGREPLPPKEAKLSAEEWKVVGFVPEGGESVGAKEEGERRKGKGKTKRGARPGRGSKGRGSESIEAPGLKKSASETSLGALEDVAGTSELEAETAMVLQSLDLHRSPMKASRENELPAASAPPPTPPPLDFPTSSPLQTPRSTLDASPTPGTPSWGGPKASPSLPPTPTSWPSASSSPVSTKSLKPKKSAKRGGLSMFLSGALEAVAAAPNPPPLAPTPPKPEGPAWGGVTASPGPAKAASLRDIQSQQGFTPTAIPWAGAKGVNAPSTSGRGELQLGSGRAPGRTPGVNVLSSSPQVAAPSGATWQGQPRAESCSPSTSNDLSHKWGSSPQEKGGSWSPYIGPLGREKDRSKRPADGVNGPQRSSPKPAQPKGAFSPARPGQARSMPAAVGMDPEGLDSEEGGPQRISLAHFVRPEALSKKKAAQEEAQQKGWAAKAPQSGPIPASSLRAIQEQQVRPGGTVEIGRQC
jgi:hypothetical protein